MTVLGHHTRAIKIALKQGHDVTSVDSWTFWLQKTVSLQRNIFHTYLYIEHTYILNKISA